MLKASDDSNFVAPGAIPWLLLEKAGTAEGSIGGSLLAQTTFIHRVNTEGGVAPAKIGKRALVPYEADYFFYKESPAAPGD